MSRILLVCLVIMAVFSSTFGQQCGLNEEFKSCGTACEPTCARPRAGVCTFQCKIGCQCKSGYLRNGSGTCVAPGDC